MQPMKPASEIFQTIGIPIVACGSTRYRGFRAFNERDIAKIQKDALQHAIAIVDRYQSSMGTKDGMATANAIWKELQVEMVRLTP